MRELLMLRHGVTEANEKRVFTGASDIPLSEGGRAALSPLLGTYPEANAFFTSGMLRARQTLALLYGDVPQVEIPDLAEYRFGDFEGRGHGDLFENEPVYRAWLSQESVDVVCPGGESRRMFDARVARGWRRLVAVPWDGRAVLVSHGGVLGSLMRQFAPGAQGYTPPFNVHGWRVWLSGGGDILRHEAFP